MSTPTLEPGRLKLTTTKHGWLGATTLPTRGYSVVVQEPSMGAARRSLSSIINHPDGVESGLVTHLNQKPLPPRSRS